MRPGCVRQANGVAVGVAVGDGVGGAARLGMVVAGTGVASEAALEGVEQAESPIRSQNRSKRRDSAKNVQECRGIMGEIIPA